MKNRKSRTTSSSGQNEVEQLLQAAQDELLLKLTVDSHMSRVAPDYLHSDLDRRFNALKSKPSSSSNPNPRLKPPSIDLVSNNVVVDEELKAVLGDRGDDLSTRFAALKASLPSREIDGKIVSSDHEDEDEVQKVIQWAIDAARLDPSPPSDQEHGSDDDRDDDSDDGDRYDDSDDDDVRRKK